MAKKDGTIGGPPPPTPTIKDPYLKGAVKDKIKEVSKQQADKRNVK